MVEPPVATDSKVLSGPLKTGRQGARGVKGGQSRYSVHSEARAPVNAPPLNFSWSRSALSVNVCIMFYTTLQKTVLNLKLT